MAAKIAWAKDQTGTYRYVREVPNGKACNCTCMDCGEPLIACHPNPLVKTAYFAHYSASACSGESILHKVAKKILEELAEKQSTISLPPYHAEVVGTDSLGLDVCSSYDEPIPKWNMQLAVSEQRIGAIILDSLVTNSAGDKLGIEIYVRNKKTDEDKIKFEDLPIEAMEIDLSDISWSVDREDLEKLLLRAANRRWLNSIGLKRVRSLVESKLPKLIEQRNKAITSEFSNLRDQIVARSFQVDIPITTLISKELTLDDKTRFRLEKHISIKNLQQVRNDLFASGDDFEADLLIDGKQNTNHPIHVIFILDGKLPKLESANVVFRLRYDEETESFGFKEFLRGALKWRERLEQLAQEAAIKRNKELESDAIQRNIAIAEEAAEQYEFLENIRVNPHLRLTLLTQRYSAALMPKDIPTEGWGLPKQLWAPLFMEFVLTKFIGNSVDAIELVDEAVLDEPLSLNRSDKSKDQRVTAIGHLLKVLKYLQIISCSEQGLSWQIGKNDRPKYLIPQNIMSRSNVIILLRHYTGL